ncbi:hypothetical protein BD310DRAFT_831562 [Dichomitus squalens]|uniref:Uncharacterized protein n=1 Tax=Dichomitus squalens TaxID=114155 RepID=A0A4Q9PI03_9APHY|nr:hypothetical protein BD310DRAFT_831562 [Dichomitus squalens]
MATPAWRGPGLPAHTPRLPQPIRSTSSPIRSNTCDVAPSRGSLRSLPVRVPDTLPAGQIPVPADRRALLGSLLSAYRVRPPSASDVRVQESQAWDGTPRTTYPDVARRAPAVRVRLGTEPRTVGSAGYRSRRTRR